MTLKQILLSITFLCFSIVVNAKNGEKKQRFYGIAQISYIINYELKEEIFDPNEGVILTNLDATGSFGFGVFYKMGYFVVPERLSLGIGFGTVFFNNPDHNTLPIYGDLSFYFSDERNTPYLILDYGGSIKIGDRFKQGKFFRLGIGYKAYVSDNMCLVMDITYAPTPLSLTDETYMYSDHTVQMKGIGITIGLRLF